MNEKMMNDLLDTIFQAVNGAFVKQPDEMMTDHYNVASGLSEIADMQNRIQLSNQELSRAVYEAGNSIGGGLSEVASSLSDIANEMAGQRVVEVSDDHAGNTADALVLHANVKNTIRLEGEAFGDSIQWSGTAKELHSLLNQYVHNLPEWNWIGRHLMTLSEDHPEMYKRKREHNCNRWYITCPISE